MKTQILVIHGGEAFERQEEYLEMLKTKNLSVDKLRGLGWKQGLQNVLGEDFDVLRPLMPNSQNARYAEWKIWFEKIVPLLDEEVILIGHSLGGIFLAKYLSENDYPKKIKATMLVAAPYNTKDHHPLVDFNIENSLEKLVLQGGKIYLYHSRDDQVVRFSNFERYQKELPGAVARVFEDRGHFNLNEFAEIVVDIKTIYGGGQFLNIERNFSDEGNLGKFVE